MKTYKVTVYRQSTYGGFSAEQKVMKAINLESLYAVLKAQGYKRYFIGSLSENHYSA